MGRTKRVQTSSQKARPKLKRPWWALYHPQKSEAKWNWALWSAVIESVQLQQLFWTALLMLVEWVLTVVSTLAKPLIEQCSKGLFSLMKQSHSACWTDNCFVRSSTGNREFLKAIVGIQKISILFRHICIFPKECNKVITKGRFHRDLKGQCTNEWHYKLWQQARFPAKRSKGRLRRLATYHALHVHCINKSKMVKFFFLHYNQNIKNRKIEREHG